MKWFLALPILLAATPVSRTERSRQNEVRMGERGGVRIKSIENAIQPADKAGNWWTLKSDGTMLSGSSLTMSGVGSPGVSPLTFDGSTQYYASSATVAFPASGTGFFVAYVAKLNSLTTQYAVAKWPAATQTFICGVDTHPLFYVFNGGGTFVDNTHSGTVTTGGWFGMCCWWDPASGNGFVRFGGVTATVAVGGAIRASTTKQTVAATATTPTLNGQMRGAFYTEPATLTQATMEAECDRIVAGAL